MDIKIPELGESITEGTISSWMKKEGDSVKFGDLLLELETDKVNLEINAESDGVLSKINRQAGETVQVGESVGVISAGQAADAQSPPAQQPAATTPSQSAPNEAVQASAGAGTVNKEAADSNGTSTEEEGPYTASPSVRKLARERGIDLNQVRSAGGIDANRVSRSDIEAYSSTGSSAGSASPAAAQRPPVQAEKRAVVENAAVDASKPTERKKMSRRRVTIANRLVEAQRTAAMLTTFNEVDMTAIMDVRKRRKQSFQEKNNVGLGFMSFFTKAVVGALKAFPLLNAEIEGEEILVKKYYDIGIAVGAKEGLVVPVVRDADRLSFAEIERNIGELAVKARDNKLSLADLQGGTFTITNGGVFGSLLSTPILNTPQVGILGMHTIQRRPVAVGVDGIENRPMMYLALSYDHRIVDGSEAVRFLVTIKQLLEDPEALLLEG
ncbi:2-oxoglutarate dehydrogenase complex dihydrolipoyllysine-residue succinyltransferase [Paenibacillus sp. FSL H7-0331]|uniref:2-oxoglutarate dehydrogenase complex dihydrolipoyllysine-residue succinyltransferase n=1 Tax=Paenibacillus sp. FSL H7-0331 TaxID=1920421 RepID=UPI00096CDB2D|nr:2-oxoglutarate dehydrogenase complex dihydrolipoyllysine-residue succinyltransferase [Paenibacillus sp. FSL H7-0331]OMF03534.1 dihydrolipoamide succinyltransferase [Paenibacillus sp. FSL H7-0331]